MDNTRLTKNRLRRFVYLLCVLILLVSVTFQVISLVAYEREKSSLIALMNQIASPTLPPSQQAIAISNYLSDKSDSTNRQYFLLPVFSFLRPTALQTAYGGGDCADQSRMMIVLLGLRDIHAEKWALYGPHMRPHHAVVELDSEHGKMVIDPLFNMWFPRPEGGYYDIESLQKHPDILRQRVHDLEDRPATPQGDPNLYHVKMHEYPLDQYIYTNARTINWEKSVVMHEAYKVLHAFLGGRANYISRPELVEQPALMVIYGAMVPEACALVLWVGMEWRRRKGSLQPSLALNPAVASSPETAHCSSLKYQGNL